MAAGLGFKNFSSGEVLTASDVNGYLMQGVGVFTDAANRDAEITSPQEGQFAYLKDTNVTTYYTGSAWANLDTTGMTNPMTTTGDTIYSSSGSTPARLGIGTAGQVLTVNSGATAPEWAAPAGGGLTWTLLNAGGTALTGAATVTVSGISAKNDLMIIVNGASSASASANIWVRLNADAGSNYYYSGPTIAFDAAYVAGDIGYSGNAFPGSVGFLLGRMTNNAASTVNGYVRLEGCNSGDLVSAIRAGGGNSSTSGQNTHQHHFGGGFYDSSATITSISVHSDFGNLDAGTVYVYGA
jgi:hypothetical protein